MFSHVTQRSVTLPARIQPPETFDFSTPNEWPKWRKRFERYLVVSVMKKKEEADKIDLLMYLMGDRADDIFKTFKFEKEEEATKIDSVLKAFDSHFCVRKNIIYERAKFNSRIQEDREPVDEFITSLYKLADSCEFEGLHEQLIRDRIVVGVRDKALSERMQLDSELTLEKAVKLVRQQEAVRQQQVDLQRPSTSQKVNQVKFNSKKQSPKQQQQPSRKKKSAKTRSRCPKCGGFTHREGQACRAEGQRCNLCSKTGHFANCCPDKQAKTAEVKAVSELEEEIGFLLEKIMGQQRLVESDINIRAAEFSELQTVGMFISTLRNGNYEIKEKIYVIRRLSEPLLSRRACELLNLARRIEVVTTRISPIKEFPEVFEGLGQIGNPYEIKLKPGAKPYAVHTPRRVPIPLMEKLKTRLEELEKAGIIAQVNVATEWCAPTVIAGKPNGDIRLCVDLSRLNEHVQREVHPMPVVEHMLGQLGEARFFSKLDELLNPWIAFIINYIMHLNCEFEGLHEQLIRDRIVVGVRDKALSERMQLDSELTLEKAVKLVRQQEAVRQQQVDLQRPSASQKVNQVKFNSKKQSPKQQQQPSRKKEKSAKTRSRCPKCGGFTHREGQACRAEGQRCNLCSKTGHFANCCPDKQTKTAEVKAVSELEEEIGFLLEVSAVEDSSNLDDDEGECRRRWTAEIQVNGKRVKFKLDSQADVTCVPLCLFKKIMGQQRLVESDINIRAAEFSELQTQRLVDGKTSEKYPTSSVLWTERTPWSIPQAESRGRKGRLGVSLKRQLEDGKDALDIARAATSQAKRATVLPPEVLY
ncbi:hypothetical protein LAZ67_14002017, partial [Cordylochernes scorpioides]